MKKKRKNRKNKNCKSNPFEGYKLPPCAQYLGNTNPLVKDGEVLYRNLNRLYLFLSYNYSQLDNIVYNPLNPLTYNTKVNGNLQIDLYTFIIGIFINEVQIGNILFNENMIIHNNKEADLFIKSIIENDMAQEYEISSTFIPSLSYLISNASAVIPFYTGNVEISIINFYIITMLSRFSNEVGLFFSDNAYITNDFINETLANIYIVFNECRNF